MGGALAIFLFLTALQYLEIDWDTGKERTFINTEKRKKISKNESFKIAEIINKTKKNTINKKEINKQTAAFKELKKYIYLLNAISGKAETNYCSKESLSRAEIGPEIESLLSRPEKIKINRKNKKILEILSKEEPKNILSSNAIKHQIMGDYMRLWSNEYQWNRVRYEEIIKAYLNSFIEIKSHFSSVHKMPGQEASLQSINLLNRVLSSNTNSYPRNSGIHYLGMFAPVKKLTKDPIYLSLTSQKIDPKVWVKQADSLFDRSIFSKREALKISLLNNQPVEVINWLIRKGALEENKATSKQSTENTTRKEETPIFYAIHSSAFTKLILENQKNVRDSNHFNKSALHYAIQFENQETTKLLIDHGFDINQKTTKIAKWPECTKSSKLYSLTPIMYAANHNKTDKIITLLLNAGAQIKHKDSTDRKFSDYLKENKNISLDAKKKVLNRVNRKMEIQLGKMINMEKQR
ncbi:MAG: ankyrin repeat domain-containing protein [Nitrospinota bacterium]|nr:ankyrin repeat domain-containing protein [Nitrospinota bacterium]